MALDIKLKALSDVHAEVIWVLDNTGVYDDPLNLTGWGDPNAELSESCLAVYAERVIDGTDNKVCEVITNQFLYDNTAVNTEIKEFQLTYDKDGQFDITLFRFKVSTDGENYVDGGAIGSDEFVWHDNQLKKSNAGTLEEVEISEALGDESVEQHKCEMIFLAKAKKIKSKMLNEYRTKRKEGCEDLDPYREGLIDIDADINSAYFAFRSNLKSTARETVEKIHEKYS